MTVSMLLDNMESWEIPYWGAYFKFKQIKQKQQAEKQKQLNQIRKKINPRQGRRR